MKKYVAGAELGIILSPKASIEGVKSRAYIGGGPKASLEMESSKLFYVPKPLQGGGRARNFSKSQSLYRGGSGKMKTYGGNMKKYEGKMKKYKGNMEEYVENMRKYEEI